MPRTTDLEFIFDETVLVVNYESCSLRLKLIGHEERNGDNITSLCNQLLLFGDLWYCNGKILCLPPFNILEVFVLVFNHIDYVRTTISTTL